MKAARPNRGKAAKRKPAKQIKNDGQVGTLMSEHGELIVCVALVIVVFVCFANALRNDFVFDVIYLVSVNNQIRSLNLPLLLSSYRPFWGSIDEHNYPCRQCAVGLCVNSQPYE